MKELSEKSSITARLPSVHVHKIWSSIFKREEREEERNTGVGEEGKEGERKEKNLKRKQREKELRGERHLRTWCLLCPMMRQSKGLV